MPLMEISLVLRPLSRADMAATLKRIGCLLLENGAKVQKLQNLGIDKELPYGLTSNNVMYTKGSYFVYTFISSYQIYNDIGNVCKRDVDIIRHDLGTSYFDLSSGCTLEEEMKPPALRKSVQDLLEKSKKNKERTKPFYWHVKEHNFYDPFM